MSETGGTAGTAPTDLRVEYERDPGNVPPGAPRFSWRVGTDARGAHQTAYRVLVARSRDALSRADGDVWDSGRVESGRAQGVTYDGVPLASDTTYYWTVRVWDGAGEPTAFADVATFSTALAGGHEWGGEWIAHQPGPGDANGYRSRWKPADRRDDPEWVRVDLGGVAAIDAIELHPASPFDGPTTPDGTVVSSLFAAGPRQDHPITARGPEGFGFPRRYRVEVAADPAFETSTVVLDRTDRRHENPGTEPVVVDADATGRYVRVVATELHRVAPDEPPQGYAAVDHDRLREEHRPWAVFALAGLAVRDEDGDDLARDRPVTASSSVESDVWGRAALVDGRPTSAVASTAPQLRTAVDLARPVERARAHVAAVGYGELFVNGERVGDRVLDPAWTDYDETVLYSTYDLTDHLSEGRNALGVRLGRGWFARNDYAWTGFGSPRVLTRVRVEYDDGSTRVVTTGGSWRATASPIVENDVYDGETYDARREEDGWTEPGFDAGHWDDATVVSGPDGTLEPQRVEPIRRVRALEPATVDRRDEGESTIVDFGQNLAGRIELALDDPEPGQAVELAHAEALTDAGDLSRVDLRSAEATDVYVARGDDRETYEPRFTYHGFRYLRVDGARPDEFDVVARACHTDMEPVGRFACSNDDLNRVQHAAEWSLRSNAVGVPTGCAQRDERTGWTGDAQLSAHALLYNFDAHRLYEKWLRDHEDDQSVHGCLADVIPHVQGGKPGDPSWTVTRVVLPWALYRFSGDPTVLRDQYDGMRRYVDYWDSNVEDGLLAAEYGSYGDWLALEHTRGDSPVGEPLALFNTASHYRVTSILSEVAGVLGHDADARRYRERAGAIAAGFDDEYRSPDGVYGPGTQAAYAVPLHLGLVPADHRDAVVENLVAKVRDDGERLLTGFLGTRALIHALAEHGHADLAYRLVARPEPPGWVYMVRQGATTLWERWDSDDRVGSGMNSFNHHQFAYVSEWFYSAIAGLAPAGAGPDGRLRFEIAPAFVDDLDRAEAVRETPQGAVSSRWEHSDGGYEGSVTLPWNSTGRLRLPRVVDGGGSTDVNGSTDGHSSSDGSDPVVNGRELRADVGGASLPAGVVDVERDGPELVVHLRAGEHEFLLEP